MLDEAATWTRSVLASRLETTVHTFNGYIISQYNRINASTINVACIKMMPLFTESPTIWLLVTYDKHELTDKLAHLRGM